MRICEYIACSIWNTLWKVFCRVRRYKLLLMYCSGGSRGGARAPTLFLDQNQARRAEKDFFGGHPPPPYLRVWITGSPLI